MLVLRKIAVTGGLASGKSSVCHLFSQLGALCVSADEIVHNLLSPHTSVGKKVISLFGKDVVNNGEIDRKAIAKIVFKDSHSLHSLEQVVHPVVSTEISKKVEQAEKEGYSLLVVEIPLLFESTSFRTLAFDATIAVVADEETCIKRYQEAGHTAEEYKLRMKNQLSPQEKAKRADYVIYNNGSEADLKAEVIKVFNTITNL